MKRPLRVAVVQLRAHDRSEFSRAWPHIVARTEDAAADAELVVLPEGTLPAYVLGEAPYDQEAVAEGIRTLRAIAERRRVAIVVGTALCDEGGQMRNAAIVIDSDGSIAGRADKIFLWHFDRRWFAPGTTVAPVTTRVGRLGVLVCADGRMPEISRTLVDRGAEILVMPTAWVSSGRDPRALENPIADLLGRFRAFENGVPFVAANKCGSERSMVLYCGKSQVIDAEGAVVALASENDEQTLRTSVEVGEPTPHRTSLPLLAPRVAAGTGAFRVAITARDLPDDIDARLQILGCDEAIAPGADERFARLDARVPTARIGDELMLDPAGLPTYRLAGYLFAIWQTSSKPWTVDLARARAGESRMYVAVLDSPRARAFIVDPDYSVVCGTLDGYRIAHCTIELEKTARTVVVPGTDVAEGLERVRAITQ